MGSAPSSLPEIAIKRGSPGPGITRISVSGFTLSHHTGRARKLADEIQKAFPTRFETWYYFTSHNLYRMFLEHLKENEFASSLAENSPLKSHRTSPIVWLETIDPSTGNVEVRPLGGRDRFCEWALEEFKDSPVIHELASTSPGLGDAWVDETPGSSQISPN